ncbi:MAG: hypothetical protein ABIO94_09045 [Opitutaceae bacterium]
MIYPCLAGRLVSKAKNLFLPIALLVAAAPCSRVLGAEKFVVHTIIDQQQGGMPFVALKAPEHWKVAGEVHWKYEDVSAPVSAFVRVWNPAKPEGVTFFPRVTCYWLEGASAVNRAGSTALGQLNVYPMPPAEALRAAILRFYHPNQPDLKLVGAREMPKLAAILKMDPKTFTGIGIKVTYQENGQVMEEEFYGLCYLNRIPYDGPQGRSIQVNWGIERVHSFKAPAGTLDQQRETFARIVYSIEPNPQWQARAAGIQKYLNDQFNRNLAQGYANIEAAGRLSRQISANNDAMIASLDSQRAAARNSGGSAGGRSANDRFDDYVRGVDTMNDPATGTSQHSSTEQYHWTDGYGNYAHSNDASFDPKQTSSINWQQMTPAR